MTKLLSLSTGVELDVIESGDPRGVPLLLLHGLSDSAPSMSLLMERLPPAIRAIAVTQRGHGDSAKPEGPYSTEAFAADAIAVLDRLGIERAIVLGHSMGSLVAQRVAADYPDRLLGLILLGAFPTLSGNPGVSEFYDAVVAPLDDFMSPAEAREFQESTITIPVPPAFLDRAVAESQKLPAHAWKAILTGMMGEEAVRLDRFRGPTLVIWGDQDAFVSREDQDHLLRRLPQAEFVAFEQTGHALHWEDPERSARVVAGFVLKQRALVAAE